MTFNIDLEEINRRTGCNFETIDNLYYYASYVLDVLKANNKNYTRRQRDIINYLWEFFQAITIE